LGLHLSRQGWAAAHRQRSVLRLFMRGKKNPRVSVLGVALTSI
jgi:hypothetical protein